MNIKSLLLGSAAALVAVSGARAADAVVIAEPEPMEYVRVCDTYGVGFYYIPGTETCLKVSGYLRYDIGVGDVSGLSDVIDKQDWLNYHVGDLDEDEVDFNDTYYKRARFQLRVDARSETELGTLRVYAAVNFNYTTNTNLGYLAGNEVTWKGYNYITDASDNASSIDHAYIQLGGFLLGKTDSLFTTMTGYAGSVIQDTLIGYGPFETNMISYTWNGGNGFSAAVSLEEGDGNSTPHSFIPYAVNVYTIDSYIPHVVAGVAYTAGWGGVSFVGGYDSVWEEGAVKGRVDFNATEALSMFLMAGWKTNGDDGDLPYNYYGPWGGDWALWGGGTWKFNEKTAANVQISYDEAEDFAFVANVAYDLVPNFRITPEIQYTDNFDADDADAWGGFLRFQANFGG